MDEQISKTLADLAKEASDSLVGLTLEQVFTDGPRRLFIEYPAPKHGTYRLYIARPFGVRKAAGQRWRIQLTVQFEGQDVQHSVNDGHITLPFSELGEVINGAAEQMQAHINANGKRIHQIRREALKVVQQPGAVEVV